MGIQISDQSTAVLRAHQASIIAAEQTRQLAISIATTNPAGAVTVRNADVAFYRSLLASARANNLDAGPFLQTLQTLGVNS
jgi:hypothetical protein